MSRSVLYLLLLLKVLFFLLGSQMVFAQEDQQMFMFQVNGKNYTKKSYDKNGKLKEEQVFKVGEIKENNQQYSMLMKVYSYDNKEVLKDSSETEYTCDPSSLQMIMNFFSFSGNNSNQKVKIDKSSGQELYPSVWEVGNVIPEVNFDMTLEGGTKRALGTNIKIKIFERKIIAFDSKRNIYTLSAKIQINAYALGFRVETMEYSLEEEVHPRKGLISQHYTQSTGEYFIIKLDQK